MSTTSEAPLLACLPHAIPADRRAAHAARAGWLFTTAARERQPLGDGYAVRFDAGAWDELAHWVSDERRCCPFLTFTIQLAAGEGPLWLRMTGPEGTVALLDAALPWAR